MRDRSREISQRLSLSFYCPGQVIKTSKPFDLFRLSKPRSIQSAS
jgi:hypothetical protein